jgi:hypothetical protein
MAQRQPGLLHGHAAHLVLRGSGLLLVGLADRVGVGVGGDAEEGVEGFAHAITGPQLGGLSRGTGFVDCRLIQGEKR